MPFKGPSWVSELTFEVPDITIGDLLFDEQYGRCAKQHNILLNTAEKGVMISHRNVIANILQITAFDKVSRDRIVKDGIGPYVENSLGVLPLSHIYGLVVVAHSSFYRGDGVVILPKFSFQQCLTAIQEHKISTLYLVPPFIILMAKNSLDAYDLSSVRAIFTGAAPLGKGTAAELNMKFPSWLIRQGYGLTETYTLACSSPEFDVWPGSSGSLLPFFEARLAGPEGEEITAYGETGELLLKSPSVVLGYWRNEKATTETFVIDKNGDRWMRTGNEAMIRKCPASGHEHVFITDRIKELIKVKGLQVAPAELEAHLLTHTFVADCVVIPVADEMAGEVPKAYIVKSSLAPVDTTTAAEDICNFVKKHKSPHKWLAGGVEYVDVIPKSPSGKILRRLLRDRERLARKTSKL